MGTTLLSAAHHHPASREGTGRRGPAHEGPGRLDLRHRSLLFELSNALTAFLDDLAAAGLADRVAVLLFSEFGRTVAENGSAGTDHGTSGPVFLAGPHVQAGLVGATPSLLDPDPKFGDLRTTIDFRRIYATILDDWLGLPARSALGEDFERLPLFSRLVT